MTVKAKAKVLNYSPAQESELIEAYTANPTKETVEIYMAKFGKSLRSIIGKLTRSKVYVKPVRATKSGEPVELKDETANAIGTILNLSEPETTSLAKANKTALQKVFAALANSVPIAD